MHCPHCGRDNPSGVKLCGAAAAPDGPTSRFAAPGAYTPKHLSEKILAAKSASERRVLS